MKRREIHAEGMRTGSRVKKIRRGLPPAVEKFVSVRKEWAGFKGDWCSQIIFAGVDRFLHARRTLAWDAIKNSGHLGYL